MTAFTTNDLPTDIDTIEKLHVWSGELLKHLYPQVKNQETSNRTEYAISSDTFFADFEDNPSLYLSVIRAVIPTDNNWRLKSLLYKSALSLGSKSIPTEFKG